MAKTEGAVAMTAPRPEKWVVKGSGRVCLWSSDNNVEQREVTMPTEAELEEFFEKAEREERRRFIDKYNFDVVKDEPMEGRYEWVPL